MTEAEKGAIDKLSTMSVLVTNGPNLNPLGLRDPEIYGIETLADLDRQLAEQAEAKGISLENFQSNGEGDIINRIHAAIGEHQAVIINAGAYSHTSIAIRDALECFAGLIVEVHISNIYRREEFRQHSFISEVADAVISGCGIHGYLLALEHVITLCRMNFPDR